MNAVIVFSTALFLQLHAQVLGSENATDSFSNSTNQQVDGAADTLFHEYWEMYLMDHPEMATGLGDNRYDDRLTGYSLKCYEKRKVMMTEFLERANQLLPLADEGSETRDNIEYFIAMLQFKIEELMSGSYLFPVSMLYTPEMGLTYLLKYQKLDEAKNFWDLTARYRAFPQQIDEQIELMREGIRTNFTLHAVSWNPRSGQQNQSAEDSRFYKPFTKLTQLDTIDDAEKYSIRQNATDAIENYIFPALEKLDDFMTNEYLLNTRRDIGVGSLPGGHEFYQHELVNHLTDKSVTPEQIHTMGVAEVQRIAQEMIKVIQSLELNMTREEFSEQLRTDKSQFFESEEEALQTYRAVIVDEIEPKLLQIFSHVPHKLLTVEKVSKDFSAGPRAYYLQASPDNSTAATFFLDTSSLANLPRFEVMTLAMHEALPGHHFQKSYTMEQDGTPEFRKHGIESNAFAEGWALYAEYLGYELGLYEDPYMRYGHLSEEMFRACRMVVDTGMHVLGWSRQEAIDYMLRYSAATEDNIRREVDRYITWPGQACAYKYGELKIRNLRHQAESALGSAFDIKEFHDVILRNSGPMELVQKQVERYIKRVLRAMHTEDSTLRNV